MRNCLLLLLYETEIDNAAILTCQVKRLVKANPELVSTKGRYLLRFPLHVATEKGFIKIIKVLIDAGEDVNQKYVMTFLDESSRF